MKKNMWRSVCFTFYVLCFMMIAVVSVSAQTWQGPPTGSTPPANNRPAPVHLGSDAQTKQGALTVTNLTATEDVKGKQICIGDVCKSTWPSPGAGAQNILQVLQNGADASTFINEVRLGQRVSIGGTFASLAPSADFGLRAKGIQRGLYGEATGTHNPGTVWVYGVQGYGANAVGVYGQSNTKYGVEGVSTGSIGVRGTGAIGAEGVSTSSGGVGVSGGAHGSGGVGVSGIGFHANAFAGEFRGGKGVKIAAFDPDGTGPQGSIGGDLYFDDGKAILVNKASGTAALNVGNWAGTQFGPLTLSVLGTGSKVTTPELCVGGTSGAACKTSWPTPQTGSQWTTSTNGIHYSGNVGVGTTPVSSGAKLDVNGNIRAGSAGAGWIYLGNRGNYIGDDLVGNDLQTNVPNFYVYDGGWRRLLREADLTTTMPINMQGNNVFLSGVGCSSGHVLKWNGSAWACAADVGGGSYTAGTNIDLTGGTIRVVDSPRFTDTILVGSASNPSVNRGFLGYTTQNIGLFMQSNNTSDGYGVGGRGKTGVLGISNDTSSGLLNSIGVHGMGPVGVRGVSPTGGIGIYGISGMIGGYSAVFYGGKGVSIEKGSAIGATGNLFVKGGGITTFTADEGVVPGAIEASQFCLGNGTNCITSWPTAGATYTAASGGGLTLANNGFALKVCTANQILKRNATNNDWECVAIPNSGITNEDDPQVGAVTNNRSCRGTGSQVTCDLDPAVTKDAWGRATVGGLSVGNFGMRLDTQNTTSKIFLNPYPPKSLTISLEGTPLNNFWVNATSSVIDGNVIIGTSNTPNATLSVTGQVKINGGSPGAGKVLTSDAAGLATWQTPAGGNVSVNAIYLQGNGTSGNALTLAAPYASGSAYDGRFVNMGGDTMIGNLVLQNADLSMTNGKAIRIDAAQDTTLYIGNWNGAGGTTPTRKGSINLAKGDLNVNGTTWVQGYGGSNVTQSNISGINVTGGIADAELNILRSSSGTRSAGIRLMKVAETEWFMGVPYNGGSISDKFVINARSNTIHSGLSGIAIAQNGFVGINWSTPTTALHVNGQIQSDNIGTKVYYAPKAQRGTTTAIPEQDIIRYCGDDDGCEVTIVMYDWDGQKRSASRTYNFFYNAQNRNWRTDHGDWQGTNGNGARQHVIEAWACYFTDGTYSNWADQGDPDLNFGILSWTTGGYNTECRLILRD